MYMYDNLYEYINSYMLDAGFCCMRSLCMIVEWVVGFPRKCLVLQRQQK